MPYVTIINLIVDRRRHTLRPFERVEHTADIGIRAFGHNQRELFANAVYGMIDILLSDIDIAKNDGHTVNLVGLDKQELLVNLLEEVLYLLNVRKFVTGSIKVNRIEECELSAELYGETYNLSKHRVEYDIKGVTFHQLEFRKEGDLHSVQVIFDI